ncbi:MAG: DUF2853 family protein [Nonlabens sp.]
MASKLDEKVGKYIDDYKKKIDENDLDVDLMRKVTKSLVPAIYNRDAETVSAQKDEMDRIQKNYLQKKLGLEGDDLMSSVETVMERYGKSNRNKYRAVVYYLLCKHHGKESVYDS